VPFFPARRERVASGSLSVYPEDARLNNPTGLLDRVTKLAVK